ncbi:MAG: hypothetical protein ACYC92_04570 [Candidatus Acidiferrales bacterium]
MFRKLFFGIWIFILVSIIIFSFFPRLILIVPWSGLESIRAFLILWTVFTFVYGMVWLYRRGMARARHR